MGHDISMLMASGLRVSDLLNLGWRNCFNQKRRSFCIIVAVAALFSVVLGFNTILNGLEMTLVQAASENSGSRFYIATGFEPETFSCKHDILLIYFVYIFLLCLLAVLLCGIITMGLVVFVTLMNGNSLAIRLQQFYYLQSVPKVVLIGSDWLSLVAIVLILLVAPIALLLSINAFSDKNLAKRLKD